MLLIYSFPLLLPMLLLLRHTSLFTSNFFCSQSLSRPSSDASARARASSLKVLFDFVDKVVVFFFRFGVKPLLLLLLRSLGLGLHATMCHCGGGGGHRARNHHDNLLRSRDTSTAKSSNRFSIFSFFLSLLSSVSN